MLCLGPYLLNFNSFIEPFTFPHTSSNMEHQHSDVDTDVETKLHKTDLERVDDDKTKDDDETQVDLREFLKQHGVSDKAMAKLNEDLDSGDLTVDVVTEMREKELQQVGKECGLSTLQTRGFINAIKLLPNAKSSSNTMNSSSANNSGTTNTSSINDYDISWEDENKRVVEDADTATQLDAEKRFKEEVKNFYQLLDNEKKENSSWIIKNDKKVSINESKLDTIGQTLKEKIDSIILKLKDKESEEFENYKTQIAIIEQDFNTEIEKISNNYGSHDIAIIIDRLMSQSMSARELSIITDVIDVNSDDMNRLQENIQKQIFLFYKGTAKASTSATDDSMGGSDSTTHRETHNQTPVTSSSIATSLNRDKEQEKHASSQREYKNPKMTTGIDINMMNVVEYNEIYWQWNYCSKPNGFWTKHIKDSKKTFDCSAKGLDCRCFARCNTPMKPNSGIYKIKFKIGKISNRQSLANIIGITCNTDNNNNWHETHHCWYYSKDYIGWSSYRIKKGANSNNSEHIKWIPGGLLCGSSICQKDNIFYKQPIQFKSFHNKYKKGLPYLKTDDSIIFEYNSDEGYINLGRCVDSKIDMIARLCNLPQNKNFYWMVGHENDPMVVSIVD